MHASLLDTRSGLKWRATEDALTLSPTRLRAWLLTGCVLSVAIAVSCGAPEAYLRTDRELGVLLRGMAAIKACLVVAAAGVLWWRFAHPIGRGSALAYGLGAVLMAAATGLIWQLTWIVPAALAFHVGLFALLCAAYVDRDTVRCSIPGLPGSPLNGPAPAGAMGPQPTPPGCGGPARPAHGGGPEAGCEPGAQRAHTRVGRHRTACCRCGWGKQSGSEVASWRVHRRERRYAALQLMGRV